MCRIDIHDATGYQICAERTSMMRFPESRNDILRFGSALMADASDLQATYALRRRNSLEWRDLLIANRCPRGSQWKHLCLLVAFVGHTRVPSSLPGKEDLIWCQWFGNTVLDEVSWISPYHPVGWAFFGATRRMLGGKMHRHVRRKPFVLVAEKCGNCPRLMSKHPGGKWWYVHRIWWQENNQESGLCTIIYGGFLVIFL